MKKGIKIIAIAIALCIALAVSAFAANFEHCADALFELGLFRGTNNGYELEREPMRSEAAAMLVRLLGAEEEAMALTYTAPFGDVADWAKPYVQYLYDKGLTKGTSETTFGYSMKCDAKQYATFLLRALGYEDSADFTYDTALEYGERIGLCDWSNCLGEVFLRDNVVAMSYTALSLPTKSGEVDLLSKLVASGAIADSKGYDAFFADMRGYTAATEALNTAKKLSADIVITRGEEKEAAKYAIELNEEDLNKSRMAYVAPEGQISKYYKDGFIYRVIDGYAVKSEATYFDAVKTIGAAVSRDPISSVRTLEKKTEGSTVTYTAVIRRELLNAATSLNGAVYASDMTVTARLEGGKVSAVTVEMNGGVGEAVATKLFYENIKTGDEAEVLLPENLDEI